MQVANLVFFSRLLTTIISSILYVGLNGHVEDYTVYNVPTKIIFC